ncbi:nicotinate-nucleotide--dimethylbenzimidazole phosphoribosyltransferase, partial [Streptomyces sp. NPDC054956]
MTDTGQVPGEGLPDSTGMVDQPGVPAQVPAPSPATGGYAFQDLVDDPAGPEDEELLLMPSSQGAWSDPQVVPPVPAFPEPSAYADAPYAEYPGVPDYQQQPVPAAEAPVAYETPGYPQPSFPDQAFPEPAFPQQPSFAEPSFTDASYGAGAHEAGGRDSGALDLGGLVAPQGQVPAAPAAPAPVRRPLHMGPPVPEATGGVVRSLADRGPAATPAPAQVPAPAVPAAEPLVSALSTPATPVPVRQPGPPTTGPEYLDLPQAEIPVQAGTPWTVEQAPEAVAAAPAPEPEPAAFAEPEARQEPQPEPVAVAFAEPVAVAVPEPEPVVVAPEPVAVAEADVGPLAAEPVVEPEAEPVADAVTEAEPGVAPEP